MAEPVRITVQGVLEDLNNGYTRTTSDKHYQGEGKSIEEKYGLNKTQVSQLFKHDKLKGRKTKIAGTPAFILIDEEEDENAEPIASAETEVSPDITDTQTEKPTNSNDEETATSEEESPSWM